jgi:hypothetical protein
MLPKWLQLIRSGTTAVKEKAPDEPPPKPSSRFEVLLLKIGTVVGALWVASTYLTPQIALFGAPKLEITLSAQPYSYAGAVCCHILAEADVSNSGSRTETLTPECAVEAPAGSEVRNTCSFVNAVRVEEIGAGGAPVPVAAAIDPATGLLNPERIYRGAEYIVDPATRRLAYTARFDKHADDRLTPFQFLIQVPEPGLYLVSYVAVRHHPLVFWACHALGMEDRWTSKAFVSRYVSVTEHAPPVIERSDYRDLPGERGIH